jgi:hypothetical protein
LGSTGTMMPSASMSSSTVMNTKMKAARRGVADRDSVMAQGVLSLEKGTIVEFEAGFDLIWRNRRLIL